MVTLELIQRIQSLYSKGAESDDSRLSSRHIYNKLSSVRAKLLAQQAKQKQKINQWNYQTIPCIEMVIAPIHECPCIPDSGCLILKSKYSIPRVLTDLNRHLIQSVTTLDGKIRFDETSFEALKNQKGNKYTSITPQYYLKNEYLYISNTKELAVITMTALFADPIEVGNFIGMCSDSNAPAVCLSPLDMEFAIDPELIDALVELTYKELIILFQQMSEDRGNNAMDDTSMRQRPPGTRGLW